MKKGLIFLLFFLTACEEVYAPAPPKFGELNFSEIGPNSARIRAELSQIGDQNISEHGFVISEDSSAQLGTNASKLGTLNKTQPVPIEITSVMSGLKANTTYYASAYAVINSQTVFSPIASFKTSNILQPGIRTDEATNIKHDAATLNGAVTTKGTNAVSEYGFVWATAENPTTAPTLKHSIKSGINNYPTTFNFNAGSLSPNATYHYRAYVISNGVTSYGVNKTFKTQSVSQPGINTGNVSNIGTSTARLEGTISSAGSYPITERGVVWGTSANPTTSHSKSSLSGNVTNFPHTFGMDISGLNINTTYYYRAYVISNGVTSYGENKSFKTLEASQPGITTGNASNIGNTNVRLEGTITKGGTYPITERGIVWATSANPTTSNSKSSLSGNVTTFPHTFGMDINGLQMNTTYHYRAYVISNGMTTYGENKTFTTTNQVLPIIRTIEAKAGNNTATLFGSIDTKGSHNITEYGMVYGTSPNPTTANSKKGISGNVNNFPHSYSVEITGLNAGSTYHYRAYVIMNGVVAYGDSKSFTTSVSNPQVVTNAASNIGSLTATANARISSQGSFPITEMGIVWATTTNPTTANSKVSKSGSGISYPHDYSFNLSGLTSNTTYYYRAYVISNGQTHYGNTVSFKTDPFVIIVATSVSTSSSYTNLQASGIRASGTVNKGSANIVQIGFLYINNLTGTFNNATATKVIAPLPANLGNSYTFTGTILAPCNGSSSFRAYAIDDKGNTTYGNVVTITRTGCVK